MKRIRNILITGLILLLEAGVALGIYALGELIYCEYYVIMKEDKNREIIVAMTQNAKMNPDKAVSIIEEIIETNNNFDNKYRFSGIPKGVLMTDYIVPILEESSKLGDPKSQYYLGRWHMGWEVFDNTYVNENENEEKAAYWFLQSSENDYLSAYGRLGICYKYGFGVKQDFRKCVEWLTKGAEGGSSYAQYFLGCTYEVGLYVKYYINWSGAGDYYWSEGIVNSDVKDNKGDIILSKGAVYYYKLGGTNDFLTNFQLRQINEKKTITYLPQDIDKAKYYWKLAAENGYDEAKEKLQKIY